MKRLTEEKIKNLPPRSKPYTVHDSGGLYLHITPSGEKYWRFRCKVTKKSVTIGFYPEISLQIARAKRNLLRQELSTIESIQLHTSSHATFLEKISEKLNILFFKK